ncbi:MAG: hypothetical protein HYX69_01330 [Planctomycetia bacterium]|nr:hypothetical protein [Planctomycetia bacterium]
MSWQRITITHLSEPVRSFLAKVTEGEGIVVEDESGRARYGVIPCKESTASERAAAMVKLDRLQQKVGDAMRLSGATENDAEKVIGVP